jgi:hypothetical protein
MDEIERIFPEEPARVTDTIPSIHDGQSACAALTVYCGSQHKREKSLQQELADLESKLPLFDELHLYLRNRFRDKWPLHVIDWFTRNKTLVDEIDHGTAGRLPAALAVILAEATEEADKLKKKYSSWMDTTAKEMAFKPDKTSRHPVYRFHDGFFTVTISEPSYAARIEDLAGSLVDRMPADPSAIIGFLQQEKARVFGRPFDATAFLERLLKNYTALTDKDPELKDGEPVPIRRITGRLHDNEKGFHTDEFLVDLTKLLDSRVAQIDGRTLMLEQTKEIERGLYVFPKHGQGYVGFLRFTRKG